MSAKRPDTLARVALYGNAAFSLITGTALLAGASPLARAMGALDPLWLQVVGALLLPFAGLVAHEARRATIDGRRTVVISAMDASWVLATAGLGLAWPSLLNALGWAIAAAVAAVVGLCATGQLLGTVRISHAI